MSCVGGHKVRLSYLPLLQIDSLIYHIPGIYYSPTHSSRQKLNMQENPNDGRCSIVDVVVLARQYHVLTSQSVTVQVGAIDQEALRGFEVDAQVSMRPSSTPYIGDGRLLVIQFIDIILAHHRCLVSGH